MVALCELPLATADPAVSVAAIDAVAE